MLTLFKKREPPESVKENLVEDLERLAAQMRKQEQNFNMLDDEDLVESSIYEYNALQKRYEHLVKKARQANLNITFLDREVLK